MNVFLKIKSQLPMLIKRGAFHIIAGNFLIKFTTFFGSIVVVRLLSKSDYGILSYTENIYGFVYLLAGAGMYNAALRYIVLQQETSDKYSCYHYIKNRAFLINLLLVGIVVIVSLLWPFPKEFQSVRYLIIIMVAMLPFQNQIDNNLATNRALFSNKTYAAWAYVTAFLVVLGKCIGAFAYGVTGTIIAVLVINCVLAVISTRYVRNKYFKEVEKKELPKSLRREMNKYSFQYMITNGLWALFMLLDVYLLAHFIKDPAVVAEYKVAYVWPGNIGIITSGIAVFVTPYFVKNEHNEIWVKKNYKKLLLINIVIVGLMAVVMYVLAKPLIFIYAGSEYYNVIPIMRLLIVAAFINNALRATTANVLAAMGQVKYNLIISVMGIVLDIILNSILIPVYGIFGAAYTSIAVYALMGMTIFLIFAGKYHIVSLEGFRITGRQK